MGNITESIERWGGLGLLDGLPRYEKEEISQLYDVATRLLLFHTQKETNTFIDNVTDVFYPVIRRVYRRFGTNIDVENLVITLIDKVKEDISYIKGPVLDGVNPLLDFCIKFADTYEDDICKNKQFDKDQYENRIDNMLKLMRDILLHDEIVSYVNRDNNVWDMKISEHKKSPTETRYWNQKTAMVFMEGVIKDTNKGI